ncbi:uncharacterized protein PFL1_01979 [Pseudozyma flocculosa PF-1]|uniref:Related to Prefoldin subunit 1 n=1 Tax=Pseudozyma flocculosa TaxID=84751 RepID=A0A5C3EZ29_9BASI|nr:uncharacterized protein PFL1_01979 [Pseudozyma flocculosa PF-1]EPQ30453.1 hypothetical protein PFL1_01979 [Pseudozyma flocculosa PF-1]SPO37534.1 related to Prefoldin subunit 1 [Pseudozyma flocculosa]
MSSNIPEDALHKILNKIQTQVVQSQRELAYVRTQIASKEREAKLCDLTLSQLAPRSSTGGEATTDDEGGYYRSVGKMFLSDTRSNITTDLTSKATTYRDEAKVLEKKQKYLEKQAADAQAHLKDIFSSVDRQQQMQAQS